MPNKLSSQSEDLVNVRDLTVCYAGSPAPAVSGLSFQMRHGERVGVVGESGSGKTTLALALSGLLPREAVIKNGSVLVRGLDYAQMSERTLRRLRGSVIGRVPQDPLSSLNPVLSVRTQLRDALRAHTHLRRAAERQKLIAALELVSIPDIATKLKSYPHELSGGMRQRVLIAMALINDPDLLIADEPTTALDATIQAQILSLIRRVCLRRDMGLILVSHNINVVASTCDRIIVMYGGEIVEDAPSDAIYASPLHPYTKLLIQASQSTPLGRTEKRDHDNQGKPSVGCQYISLCPHRMSKCGTDHPSLEHMGSERYVRCFAVTSIKGLEVNGAPVRALSRSESGARHMGLSLMDLSNGESASAEDTETRDEHDRVLLAEELVRIYKLHEHSGRRVLRAVDGVSLECYAGETIGIVGESGCGKTTLGRMISGLIQPTSGRLYVGSNGGDLVSSFARRGIVQMVFQNPAESLDPRLTIRESVREPLFGKHDQTLSDRVSEALLAVGLGSDVLNRLPHQLSGGQQQRACIARAIIGSPSIVVLDEAISSLDVILQNDILRVLVDLQRQMGVAYIFISHDMKAVLGVSSRVIVMYLGRVVESIGREAFIRDRFLHPYSVLLEAAQPRPGAPGSLPMVVESSGDPVKSYLQSIGCRFADRCPLADDRCRSEEPELQRHGTEHAVACYHAGELEGAGV